MNETHEDDPTASEGAEDPAPAIVGRYALIRELGRGGMGVVYLARDGALDRNVAVKLLHRGTGTSGTSRLVREARAMAQLSHPNVVSVFEVGMHDDRPFIVMELIDGVVLSDWLGEKSRPWREVVRVFLQAGRGLEAAHALGLVHRDFKPANVMIAADGRARVLDFGLAKPHGVAEPPTAARSVPARSARLEPVSLTQTGTVVGTPAYMAPEQHREGGAVDARADQFGFCVALYEGLYGERPFRGTYDEVLPKVFRGELDPTPKGRPVPPRLLRILERGLRPNVGD